MVHLELWAAGAGWVATSVPGIATPPRPKQRSADARQQKSNATRQMALRIVKCAKCKEHAHPTGHVMGQQNATVMRERVSPEPRAPSSERHSSEADADEMQMQL